MVSVSSDEIPREEDELLTFKIVKDILKLNNIADLKGMQEFTNETNLHSTLLFTVLQKLFGGKSIKSEIDYRLLGFQDSNEIIDYFKKNNGLFLLLHLLFLFESDPIHIQQAEVKNTIMYCSRISQILVKLLEFNQISTVPKFFVYFSSAVHHFKDCEDIQEDISIKKFQEILDERLFSQINFS